jgi:low temperature requirement protein LtrA
MNRELLARVRVEFWQAPRAHGEILRDRSVGPLELFYDLVVVVLVGQAAHHLSQHLTPAGLGEFAAVFAVVWIAWFNATLHHELHGREDVRARNTFLGQILLLVPLGAFIPAAGGVNGRAFAIDSALLFGYVALLWWRAGRHDTADFTTTTRLYVWATLALAAGLAGSATLPADVRLAVWAVLPALFLLVVVAVFAVAPSAVAASFTITDALAERFGALVIIVLGETVTGVVTGLAVDPLRPISLAVGLTAVLVAFGSWWTYFDFAGHGKPRGTRPASLAWMLGHLPICGAIAAMGAAIVTLIEHASAGRTNAAVAWVLSGGTIVMLVFVAAQITCLDTWRPDRSLQQPLSLVCLLTCPLVGVIGLLRPSPLALAAALALALAIPWTFAVIRTAQLAPSR